MNHLTPRFSATTRGPSGAAISAAWIWSAAWVGESLPVASRPVRTTRGPGPLVRPNIGRPASPAPGWPAALPTASVRSASRNARRPIQRDEQRATPHRRYGKGVQRRIAQTRRIAHRVPRYFPVWIQPPEIFISLLTVFFFIRLRIHVRAGIASSGLPNGVDDVNVVRAANRKPAGAQEKSSGGGQDCARVALIFRPRCPAGRTHAIRISQTRFNAFLSLPCREPDSGE